MSAAPPLAAPPVASQPVASQPVAALPMYDRPENAAAHDRLWQAVRARLGHGPDQLLRGADTSDIWRAPGLVLSQTCSLPYRTELADRVTLVAAPDHGLADCPAGSYYSVFVVRRADAGRPLEAFATARLAYNEALSQSGWAAPFFHARALGFRFQNRVASGAHRASARMVAEGGADIAALDAVSWAMLRAHDPFAADLVEIARTVPSPALPYITARGHDPAPVFAALAAAIDALSAADRDRLQLFGITPADPARYQALAVPPPPFQPDQAPI